MLVENGVAGESLRGLTDADAEILTADMETRLRELQRDCDLARDDVFQLGMKEGFTGFA